MTPARSQVRLGQDRPPMRSGMRLEDAGLQGPTRQLLPRSRSRHRKKPQVELASHRSSSSGPPRLRDPRRMPPKRLRRCGGYRWLSPHELVCWARSSCENTFSLLLPSRRVEGRVRYRPRNWSSRPRACPKQSPVGRSGVDRWSGILDAERQRSHSVSMAVHLVCARFLGTRLGGCAARVIAAQRVAQCFCVGFHRPAVVPARIGSRKVAASACAVPRSVGSPTSSAARV